MTLYMVITVKMKLNICLPIISLKNNTDNVNIKDTRHIEAANPGHQSKECVVVD